jgi:hypothetical protein
VLIITGHDDRNVLFLQTPIWSKNSARKMSRSKSRPIVRMLNLS